MIIWESWTKPVSKRSVKPSG